MNYNFKGLFYIFLFTFISFPIFANTSIEIHFQQQEQSIQTQFHKNTTELNKKINVAKKASKTPSVIDKTNTHALHHEKLAQLAPHQNKMTPTYKISVAKQPSKTRHTIVKAKTNTHAVHHDKLNHSTRHHNNPVKSHSNVSVANKPMKAKPAIVHLAYHHNNPAMSYKKTSVAKAKRNRHANNSTKVMRPQQHKNKIKINKRTNTAPQTKNTPVHTTYLFQQMSTFARLTYDPVKMPDSKEKKMGMLGFNYLFNITPWFYAGPAVYGSVSGDRGGLFVTGFEAGINHPIYKNLGGDLGFFAGGGGGRSRGRVALVGGGLMIRPHVGLYYNFGLFRLGVNYSQIRFPKGKIDGKQVSLALDIPFGFGFANPVYNRFHVSDIKSVIPISPGYINFGENTIAMIAQTYVQSSSNRQVNGTKSKGNLRLVGIELTHYMTLNTFLYAKAAGLYSGDRGGYMDALAGIGYRYPIFGLSQIALMGRIGAGAGGGGNFDTGGGVLLQSELGLNFQFTKSIGVEVSGGYLYAPDGRFKAKTITAKLIYRFLSGHFSQNWDHSKTPGHLMFRGWRFRAIHQTYIHPQRLNKKRKNISLVGMKFDGFLTRYLYVTGQSASAYIGKSGGYASGLLGLGLQSPRFWNHRFDVSVEMLGGAAGGGGIDVGRGAVWQPVVNADFYITPYISVEASTGRIIATNGKLDATTASAGLAWHFSTLMGM